VGGRGTLADKLILRNGSTVYVVTIAVGLCLSKTVLNEYGSVHFWQEGRGGSSSKRIAGEAYAKGDIWVTRMCTGLMLANLRGECSHPRSR